MRRPIGPSMSIVHGFATGPTCDVANPSEDDSPIPKNFLALLLTLVSGGYCLVNGRVDPVEGIGSEV